MSVEIVYQCSLMFKLYICYLPLMFCTELQCILLMSTCICIYTFTFEIIFGPVNPMLLSNLLGWKLIS